MASAVSASDVRDLHGEFSSLPFEQGTDAEIEEKAKGIFERYAQLPQFVSILKKVLSGSGSSNQSLVGFDEVNAELIAGYEGIYSVLMHIFKPVQNIGSLAQNSILRVVDVKDRLVIETYAIRGYSSHFDIQRDLSLELIGERSLSVGDIAFLKPGPFAYKFRFDPPGAVVHRMQMISGLPFSHSFDASTLQFMYSNFAGQEETRDQFLSLLLRKFSEQMVSLHGASDDPSLKAVLETENAAVMDYLQKVCANQQVNSVTRWQAVQTLSLFRPEQALESLRALEREDMPHVNELASRSATKLESYLAGSPS